MESPSPIHPVEISRENKTTAFVPPPPSHSTIHEKARENNRENMSGNMKGGTASENTLTFHLPSWKIIFAKTVRMRICDVTDFGQGRFGSTHISPGNRGAKTMVFSAFREVNPKDHSRIYPLNSSQIRSKLEPWLSIHVPGLFDLPPHPLSFFGVFGILAAGHSIVRGKMTALTPDGIHYYTAMPARYFFSDDQDHFFGNGRNTASGCSSNYNAPIYQPFLYVRQWRITQDRWQPVARRVFRLQVPIPTDTIEIPKNARDRRMLLICRDQGLLSLERLFTGKNLVNYTHLGDVTFTSLTFLGFGQVRTLPPVPQDAIHEAVAIALGHSSSNVGAGRRVSAWKKISAQGSVLDWWHSLVWRNSRWSCLASEPIPEGTFKQTYRATDPVFRGDLLIYHDEGRGLDTNTNARLIVNGDPDNDIFIPIKRTQDGQLRFELPGGKLLHTPEPQKE